MKVALAQLTSGGCVATNLDHLVEQIREAARLGAHLAVFPEATMRAFGHPLTPIAEPLDGPWATRVRQVVAECGLTVIVGMFTPARSQAGHQRVRNTLLVTGGVEASYDKIHLFDALGVRESAAIEPGNEMVIIEVHGVRVGLATCYDLRFPEHFRELARRGAQVIAVPASWANGPGKASQLRLLSRARALDSTSWVLLADQALPPTPSPHPTGIGLSAVVRPDGTDAERLGPSPDMIVFDLDLTDLSNFRASLPVLGN